VQRGAVSRFRLFLIAGCLAAAVASGLSSFQLSLRAGLVGAALVAAVLLLAIRRDAAEAGAPETEAQTGRVPGSTAPDQPARAPRRLFGKRDTEALDARISAITGQLERYEQKLREVSVAQAAAERARKQELDSVRQQLADLQAVNEEQRATIASLNEQHGHRLARLQETIAGQREALAGLERALETALVAAPAPPATSAPTDSAPTP
jgi:hypothetical protein